MELELFYGGRYFKGDSIRLCLAYAGLEFEDIRQDHARWPEFDAMKAAGELPFGQMPVLRVGGAGGTLCAPHQIPPPPPPTSGPGHTADAPRTAGWASPPPCAASWPKSRTRRWNSTPPTR